MFSIKRNSHNTILYIFRRPLSSVRKPWKTALLKWFLPLYINVNTYLYVYFVRKSIFFMESTWKEQGDIKHIYILIINSKNGKKKRKLF